MRASASIFALLMLCFAVGDLRAAAQTATPQKPQVIDGVAVRIEDDIITESEIQELARFQKLVDGHPQSRSDLIRELVDQWIVRNEANTTKYPMPSTEDIQREYEQLVKHFSSEDDFKARSSTAGLTEAAVRRLLEQQIFLTRFLDYRFRPTVQVGQEQIATYYEKEFVPQLRARNETVPPVDDVAETIREILTQRVINENSTKWLDDTRAHLRIDISKGSDS